MRQVCFVGLVGRYRGRTTKLTWRLEGGGWLHQDRVRRVLVLVGVVQVVRLQFLPGSGTDLRQGRPDEQFDFAQDLLHVAGRFRGRRRFRLGYRAEREEIEMMRAVLVIVVTRR